MGKHRIHIVFLLLLFCAACHTPTREARRMVDRAEHLADTLPDSTAHLIDSVLRMPVYFSERERMDMALLQAEALFGDHGNAISPVMDDDFFDEHTTLSTSPDLERATEYFAKKKQFAKATHAALYSGFVQQHYNEKEEAMRSFKDAEHYGELAKDSLAVAQAQYWMGKMLLNDGMYKDALVVINNSEHNFGNYYSERALSLNMLAVCYLVLGEYENAEISLKQSLVFAQKSHDNKIKRKALNNYAVLFRLQEEYDRAIACLGQIGIESNLDDTELLLFNLNIADVFLVAQEKDSAALHYELVNTLLPKTNVKAQTRVSAYESLSKFAEIQNEDSMALYYWKLYIKWLNRVRDEREQTNVYGIQRKYDYESLQNTMNQQIARKQRIIAISIVLLLFVVTWFMYRTSQRNKREAEANANLFHFMEQNKALVESNIAHEKKVLDTTQQLSDLLYARLKAMQKLDYCLKTPKDKIALKDLEKEVFGTGDHWDAIREVLVALYPGLLETLKLKYPEMDEMELRVCMLSRLKLSRLAESTLLGISVSVLDKTRTKVHKIIGQDNKQ